MSNSKYAIKPIETEKDKTPLRACMKNGILPRFPSSMMISGRSGSGKTVAMLNLLTNEHLLKGYYHYICVFSPTANLGDDTYKILKLPAENFKNEFTEEDLETLISNRKSLIDKKGIEYVVKNSRVLIIIDDCIADRSFLNSESALKTFAPLRHYQISVMILIQSYNKVPRALRVNANATIVFPSTQSEVEILLEEITPAGISKKEFQKVIEYATAGKHDFLYINRHAERGEQIRKNLDEVIDINLFKKEK